MNRDQSEPSLTVVIPTLDAARHLPRTLDALAPGRSSGLIREVLVVDGGSRDGTLGQAAAAGARVLASPPGRGRQLATGGEGAEGSWLLFLHADTCLEAGWEAKVRAFIASLGAAENEQAAFFRLALDDQDPRARRVERWAAWRGRRLGLPYGDQGLLISRAFYRRVGGFRPLSLMEDVDLVRRIGKSGLILLDCRAVTSAERYQAEGWRRRPLRNLSVLTLYYLGLPNSLLARLYG